MCEKLIMTLSCNAGKCQGVFVPALRRQERGKLRIGRSSSFFLSDAACKAITSCYRISWVCPRPPFDVQASNCGKLPTSDR